MSPVTTKSGKPSAKPWSKATHSRRWRLQAKVAQRPLQPLQSSIKFYQSHRDTSIRRISGDSKYQLLSIMRSENVLYWIALTLASEHSSHLMLIKGDLTYRHLRMRELRSTETLNKAQASMHTLSARSSGQSKIFLMARFIIIWTSSHWRRIKRSTVVQLASTGERTDEVMWSINFRINWNMTALKFARLLTIAPIIQERAASSTSQTKSKETTRTMDSIRRIINRWCEEWIRNVLALERLFLTIWIQQDQDLGSQWAKRRFPTTSLATVHWL